MALLPTISHYHLFSSSSVSSTSMAASCSSPLLEFPSTKRGRYQHKAMFNQIQTSKIHLDHGFRDFSRNCKTNACPSLVMLGSVVSAASSTKRALRVLKDHIGSGFMNPSSRDFFTKARVSFLSHLCDASTNGAYYPEEESVESTNEAILEDEDQSPSLGIGFVSAKITPQTHKFFSSEMNGDPDCPSQGFSSIVEAVDAVRQGKLVVVVDDEGGEHLGDLIMAGSLVTRESLAFLMKHGTGIVCVGMIGEDLDRLKLPLLIKDEDNKDLQRTAFTISVDVKVGTSTGVSASDRAKTILALASLDSKPEHFRKPGHIFPLRYQEGGVFKRAGHTEASVDLAVMAGLPPIGALSGIVDKDGSEAPLPWLRDFAYKYSLPIISISDLIRYRRKREKIVERTAVARLPTKWGNFKAYSYRSKLDSIEHVAMVKGDIGDGLNVLVRVHSECLTGDIFGSTRCDCGNQLEEGMRRIAKCGRGVLVYLRGHEGRGIGLGHKLRAYNLQDNGRDTVEANVELGLPVDSREYGIGAQILRDIGVQTMKLMTNNPSKFLGLKGYGLAVTDRIPVISPTTTENEKYLETKRKKMGHIYGSDLPGSVSGLNSNE